MGFDFNFFIAFIYNQFRRVPSLKHDFTSKTVIVTGANVGLGLEAARHFARLGAAKVIIACRNTEKGERAKIDIERSTARSGVVEVWPLDLSSFESVRHFCRLASQLSRLDAVVENAGVAEAGSQGSLAEGYEQTVTVNVISTFLMALLLLPTLTRTAAAFNVQPSLTIVSSDAHFEAEFKERTAPVIFDAFRSPAVGPDRYPTSKLLEILLVRQLAQEMSRPSSNSRGIILNTANPGFCRTALFRDSKFPESILLALSGWLLGRSADAGSRVLVDAAAAGPETHGKWMDTFEIREPSAYVRSEEGQTMQRKLYDELMAILDQAEPGVTAFV